MRVSTWCFCNRRRQYNHCSKVVAAGARYDGDAWDLVLDGSKGQGGTSPIFDVLTLSRNRNRDGSFAVISDMSKNEKWGTGSPYMVPTMSILNPEYTFSVSKNRPQQEPQI